MANVGTHTVTWNGAIAGAGSVTITIAATVNAGTQGTRISNQGNEFFDADGNGSNESTGVTDDPSVAGVADATAFLVDELIVPTLSDAALALLALMLLRGALLAHAVRGVHRQPEIAAVTGGVRHCGAELPRNFWAAQSVRQPRGHR